MIDPVEYIFKSNYEDPYLRLAALFLLFLSKEKEQVNECMRRVSVLDIMQR